MIISLSVLVITIIVSGTYALYKAQLSKNIGVNTTTHGLAYYINYVKGTDITADLLVNIIGAVGSWNLGAFSG